MPGELLCGWELFALEWSWTQESFAGDLEGEVKHQPSCSEGEHRVIHNIADLLVDLGGVGQRLGLQHLWFPVGLLLLQVL